ncbi:MAG TPA: YdcH family protein [Hydrogenophaga sp.]|nr:YdcH family protein [Hydrogenophaga sp.]
MFPEYRDLISRLKGHDIHFTRLFDKHNDLDQRITNMEAQIQPSTQPEIENLKKEKLLLKDQLYLILKKAQEKGA